MSANRNIEERAAAYYANFEEKVDLLVNQEKASFKQFCQSEFNKLKESTTSSSFEDSGIPDFDSSSVVNSTVIPPPPDLHPRSQVYPLQIYVPPPPILARLLKIESQKVSPPRPIQFVAAAENPMKSISLRTHLRILKSKGQERGEGPCP